MNEFLRQNRELFSNKREFLTKLREVRQKLMNSLSSTAANGTGAAITNIGQTTTAVCSPGTSSPSAEITTYKSSSY